MPRRRPRLGVMVVDGDFPVHPRKVNKTESGLPIALHPSPPPQADGLAGLILAPSSAGGGAFDDAAIGGPVVLPPDATTPVWRMWYNGRSSTADKDRIPLPTGAIGAATSPDGVTWTRVTGAAGGGAVLDRAADAPTAWDHVHIGTGSIVAAPAQPPGTSNGDKGGSDDGSGQRLTLYYFGGSAEAVTMPAGVWAPGPMTIRGLRMRVGVAESVNGGQTWARVGGSAEGVVLDVGAGPDAWDALYVGWPHVRVVDDVVGCDDGGGNGSNDGGASHGAPPPTRLALTYHTYHIPSRTYRVGEATSTDGGSTWTPAPAPLLAAGSGGTWDDGGHGTRWVVQEPPAAGGRLLMFVEGARAGTAAGHSIGVMVSSDGGTSWDRASDGPVLAPGVAAPAMDGAVAAAGAAAGGGQVVTSPPGAWDSISVGCPCVVWDAVEGHWKVYYVGFGPSRGAEGGLASGIGLAVSAGADWSVLTRVGRPEWG